MKIETIDGNPTRMLEDVFTKGERNFVAVKTYSLEHSTYKLFKVTFHIGTKMEYNVLELFKQKFFPKSNLDTNESYTHIEKYPSDSDFGYWAWSLMSVEAADEKVLELTNKKEYKKVYEDYKSPNEFEIRDRVRYLGNEFRTQGRNFRLIKQVGDYKVFAVGLDGAKPSMKVLELVKTYIKDKNPFDECEDYDKCEFYPSDNMWGTRGWSATKMETIDAMLKKMVGRTI